MHSPNEIPLNQNTLEAPRFKLIECAGFQIYVEPETEKVVKAALEQAVKRNWYSGLAKNVILAAQVRSDKIELFALNTPNVTSDARSIIFYHQDKPYEVLLSAMNGPDFMEYFMHELPHGTLELANPRARTYSPEACAYASRLRDAYFKDAIAYQKNRLTIKYAPIEKKVAKLIFNYPNYDYLMHERGAERICFTLQALMVSEKAVKNIAPNYLAVLNEYVNWETNTIKQLALVNQLVHNRVPPPCLQITYQPGPQPTLSIKPSITNVVYPEEIIDPRKPMQKNLNRSPVIEIKKPDLKKTPWSSMARAALNVVRLLDYGMESHQRFGEIAKKNPRVALYVDLLMALGGAYVDVKLISTISGGNPYIAGLLVASSLVAKTPDLKTNFDKAWENLEEKDFIQFTEEEKDRNLILFGNPWGPNYGLKPEKLEELGHAVLNLNHRALEAAALQKFLTFIGENFDFVRQAARDGCFYGAERLFVTIGLLPENYGYVANGNEQVSPGFLNSIPISHGLAHQTNLFPINPDSILIPNGSRPELMPDSSAKSAPMSDSKSPKSDEDKRKEELIQDLRIASPTQNVFSPPTPKESPNKGFGDITPYVEYNDRPGLDKGIKFGALSTNNASGMNVDIGFSVNLDGVCAIIEEAGNRLFSHVYFGDGKLTIANETYSYNIRSVGGHRYRLKITLKNEVTGQESASYVHLKEMDVTHRRNEPQFASAWQKVFTYALQQRYPAFEADQGQLPTTIQEAIDANEFVKAYELVNQFCNKYQNIDGVKAYTKELINTIAHNHANEQVVAGQAFEKAGKYDEAMLAYKKAQDLLPNHSGVALALAGLYAQDSDYVSAIDEVKKVPTSPEITLYLKKLEASWTQQMVSPHLNVLFQVINEHIQLKHLNPNAEQALRLISAVHHLHPQLIIAAPYLVSANPQVVEAWSGILKQRASAPLSLFKGLLGALHSLNVSQKIPYFNQVEEMSSYAQQLQIGSQLFKDLGVMSGAGLVNPGFSLAVRNGSINTAIATFVAPMLLRLYDWYHHSQLLPETLYSCIKRDAIIHATSVVGSFFISKPLRRGAIITSLALPFLKAITGLYKAESHQGLLTNGRQFLLKNEARLQKEAQNRYTQLPGYDAEIQFKKAIFDPTIIDLSHFEFSLTGGQGTVSVQLALPLLGTIFSSEEFNTLQFSKKKESCLSLLIRIKNLNLLREHPYWAANAKRLYAVGISPMGYLNTLTNALEETLKNYDQIRAQQSIATKFFDYVVWLANNSKPKFLQQQTELASYYNRCRDLALKFSSGAPEAGFGLERAKLLLAKNPYDREIMHEVKMLEVLKYLYSDEVLDSETELCLFSTLKTIGFNTTNKNTKQLAYFVLNQLLNPNEGERQVHISYSKAKQLFNPNISTITTEERPLDVSNAESLLRCYYNLMNNKTLSDNDNATLNEMIKDYTLLPDINLASSKQSLLSAYLSAMVTFAYLVKNLTKPSESTMSEALRFEILDSILLRGYLPPFAIMMVRTLGDYTITKEQAHTMLSMYDIDLDNLTASEKLDILLTMQKHSENYKPVIIATPGDLYRKLGFIIRQALFPHMGSFEPELSDIIGSQSGVIDIKRVGNFLRKGGDPNKFHLLDLAVWLEQPDLVDLLCQYGASIDIFAAGGLTPIQRAAIKFAINPTNTSLKKIICQLCFYGSNLDDSNRLSFFLPNWWLHYGGKSSRTILNPFLIFKQLEESDLMPGTMKDLKESLDIKHLKDFECIMVSRPKLILTSSNRSRFFSGSGQSNTQAEANNEYCRAFS